jgi:hypothetical protein
LNYIVCGSRAAGSSRAPLLAPTYKAINAELCHILLYGRHLASYTLYSWIQAPNTVGSSTTRATYTLKKAASHADRVQPGTTVQKTRHSSHVAAVPADLQRWLLMTTCQELHAATPWPNYDCTTPPTYEGSSHCMQGMHVSSCHTNPKVKSCIAPTM